MGTAQTIWNYLGLQSRVVSLGCDDAANCADFVDEDRFEQPRGAVQPIA